jgi:integrase
VPKFTDKFLSAVKVEEGRKDRLIFDSGCPGLGVRVTSAGSKVFIVQWTDRTTGRKQREPLGRWGGITLEQARVAARAHLGEAAKGTDVRAERAKRKIEAERVRSEEALTLDALITDWATLHLANRRANYRDEAQRALRYAFQGLLKRPAARMDRASILAVLDLLAKADKAAMVARTVAYGRACFSWALKRGKVPGNPFSGLPVSTTTASRDRVLNDEELSDIWKAAATLSDPWGPFFQIVILTLQRRSECAGMKWSEISSDLTTWQIPGERMKTAKAHIVHLPEAARRVLRTVTKKEGCDFVFTTNHKTPISGLSKAKIALDQAIVKARAADAAKTGTKPAPLVAWRIHDLRRSGVTVLAKLGFDSIVADLLLAHSPTKLAGVAGVYQKHGFEKERQKALAAWARYVVGGAADKVVQLRTGL